MIANSTSVTTPTPMSSASTTCTPRGESSRNAVSSVSPSVVTLAPAMNAAAWARQQFGGIKPLPARAIEAHATIRAGFLTSDLHEHATAYLIAEIFALMDTARFSSFVYSYGVASDAPARQRIAAGCTRFADVRALDAAAIARTIREDEIDILIDLKGYTRGGRLDILAYRPAPVQMHWLGFPGTLGCPFIDYFIADAVALPPALEPFFSERILRLPGSYQCNDRQKALPPALERAAHGLPEDAVVYGSLNQSYKLHAALLDCWAGILRETPGSLLWLLASNDAAPGNIRAFMAARGIEAARVRFAPPVGQDAHLQRYHAVDVALDPFPIGGHTTTSDALWMGTPVVTLAGDSFVSRVAASLLTAARQEGLIAKDMAQYQALAAGLGRDAGRRLLADEKNFIDLANSVMFFVEEREIIALAPKADA